MWKSLSYASSLKQKTLQEICNFIFCGSISAAIYFLSIYLLERINPGSVGVNFSIAFTVSSGFNFFYNKIITFDTGKARVVRHGLNFIMMLFATYLSNILVITFLVKNEILDLYMSSVVAIGFNTVFRFLLSKYLVFK